MSASKEETSSPGFTEKERLRRALTREKIDRTPVICPGGMMTMASTEVMEKTGYQWPLVHCDPRKMAGLARSMHDLTGLENLGVPFCMTVEAEAFGCPVDYGKIDIEPRVRENILENESDLKSLKALNPRKDGRMPVVLEAIAILRDISGSIPVTGNLVGPVSLAASLMEASLFLRLLRKNPRYAHQILDFLTGNLMEFGQAQIREGADVIAISDPTATGEILGPSLFEEFGVTYLNRLIESLQAARVIVHICGNVKAVIKQLKELKADCLSVDATVSIQALKDSLDIAVMGNISTYLLEKGPAERISQAAENIMISGIDILSPACGLSPRTSIDNIRALTGAAKNHIQAYEPH